MCTFRFSCITSYKITMKGGVLLNIEGKDYKKGLDNMLILYRILLLVN